MVPKEKKDEINTEQQQVLNNEEKNKEPEISNINVLETNINPNPESTDLQQPTTEKTAEMKKKIRCKKWPLCKNEGCEFSHPKETVKMI